MKTVHLESRKNMNEEKTPYEKKETTIIVNTIPKIWPEKEISFEQVIKLAFANPPTGPDTLFLVTYHKRGEDKKDLTMTAGQTVHVKDGMIFDVEPSNRS